MKGSKFGWFVGGAVTVLVLLIVALGAGIFWFISQNQKADQEPVAEVSSSASVSVSASPSVSATPVQPTVVADGTCVKPEDVDTSSADAVAQGYAQIAYCMDPYFDKNMTAAALRSEKLMSGAMFDRTWEARDVRSAQQNQFVEASKSHAYSVASAQLVGSQFSGEVDDATAARTVQVKWYWQGRDGETVIPGGTAVLQIKLTHNVGNWYVDNVEVVSVNAL